MVAKIQSEIGDSIVDLSAINDILLNGASSYDTDEPEKQTFDEVAWSGWEDSIPINCFDYGVVNGLTFLADQSKLSTGKIYR